MSDHRPNSIARADDDTPSKRESHFDAQRSSYRSSLNSNKSEPNPRSRPHSQSRSASALQRLADFNLDLDTSKPFAQPDRADSDTLGSPIGEASPAPYIPYRKHSDGTSVKRQSRRLSNSGRPRSTPRSRQGHEKRLEELLSPDPENWLDLGDTDPQSPTPPPIETSRRPFRALPRDDRDRSNVSRSNRTRRPSFPLSRGGATSATSGSQLDITALPDMNGSKENDLAGDYVRSKRSPGARTASRFATELYTVSYLIFFAVLGTLARLGLQALTFYPGAPVVFSEIWANVAGTFIIGFLAEDRRLFRSEWGMGERVPEPLGDPLSPEAQRAKAAHGKAKKTIPLYIGLATGFCGSFTSFSSFMRDIFLALSNDLKSPINHPYPADVARPSTSTTVPRNRGDSFMAIWAVIIITFTTCYCALKLGAHLAVALDRFTPTLPFRFTRRIVDPIMVFLGWGVWLGAIVMVCIPPNDAWRGQGLFACVFAPVGCILRFYVSLFLNPIMPSFPLGTFTVNIFGTAVLGMAYDLQHVSLIGTGVVGGSLVGCQVLQGIMDGFCGALTTVSTWILEIDVLRRKHAYTYALLSIAVGLSLLVIIMGSVRWTIDWSTIVCTI